MIAPGRSYKLSPCQGFSRTQEMHNSMAKRCSHDGGIIITHITSMFAMFVPPGDQHYHCPSPQHCPHFNTHENIKSTTPFFVGNVRLQETDYQRNQSTGSDMLTTLPQVQRSVRARSYCCIRQEYLAIISSHEFGGP